MTENRIKLDLQNHIKLRIRTAGPSLQGFNLWQREKKLCQRQKIRIADLRNGRPAQKG